MNNKNTHVWKIQNKITQEIKEISREEAVKILKKCYHDVDKFYKNFANGEKINILFVILWVEPLKYSLKIKKAEKRLLESL